MKLRFFHLGRNGDTAPRKVRYAVVGLGHIAQNAVLPAFANARANSELTALFSSTPRKRAQLGKEYQVPHVLSYDQYNAALADKLVDAVYIALPNDQHADFAIRAAQAGIHVLCEKPMAMTARDCAAMIAAAKAARVKLMIAYRLHFEAANLEAIHLVGAGELGEPRFFNATFSMQVKPGNVRLSGARGGGTLYDIGIYCINAVRGLFRAEPTKAAAFSVSGGQKRFSNVDEMTAGTLWFPEGRLAQFTCSFGAADTSMYEVIGTKGRLRVEPAFDYEKKLQHVLTVNGRETRRKFARRDQFAPELLHFSDCILNDRSPSSSGAEGLADVRVIEALYQSAQTGRAIAVQARPPRRRPKPKDEIHRPPPRKKRQVAVSSPHK